MTLFRLAHALFFLFFETAGEVVAVLCFHLQVIITLITSCDDTHLHTSRFKATAETTDPLFPFGVTQLAGYGFNLKQ